MKNTWKLILRTVLFVFPVLGFLFSAMPLIGAEAQEEWKAPARAARKPNPVPADEKSVAAGKAVYAKECYSCHGTTGKGNGPAAKDLEKSPGDLSNPKVWNETDGALFWKITTGKKPMASYEKLLTDEQRWQVINYVRTLAPRPADKAPKINN